MPPKRFKISGEFIVRVWNKNMTIIERELRFPNLIVNAGKDALNASTFDQVTTFVAVGTGSSVPAVTDTTLNAEIARTNNTNGVSDTYTAGPSNSYWEIDKTRLFTAGTATGNLTELGFFQNGSGAPMWTRQLFKDNTGTPTTVVVTSSNQLQIVYRFRITPPADVSTNVTISGTVYPITVRAVSIDNHWGSSDNAWPGRFTGNNSQGGAFESNALLTPTGTSFPTITNPDTTTPGGYVNGTFLNKTTYVYNPSTAVFGTGIGSLVYGPFNIVFALFQVAFTTTKIPKLNTQTLTIIDQISWT